MSNRKIRVLLVDDHAVVRHGVRCLLEDEDDMEVVAEASDGEQAIKLAASTFPDVALVDLSMPGIGGIRTIEGIIEKAPKTRALVLTMHDDQSYVRSALAAGACGYIAKKVAHTEVVTAVRAIHRGRSHISVSVPPSGFQEESPRKRPVKLSAREREVLGSAARGFTNQETADRMSIGVKTVETYRARIMEKLGSKKRTDLIRYALDHGLHLEEK